MLKLVLTFGSLDLSTRWSACFWFSPRSFGLFLELIKVNYLLSPPTCDLKLHWVKSTWPSFFPLGEESSQISSWNLTYSLLLKILLFWSYSGTGAYFPHSSVGSWLPFPAAGTREWCWHSRDTRVPGQVAIVLHCGDPGSRPQGLWFLPLEWRNAGKINSSFNFLPFGNIKNIQAYCNDCLLLSNYCTVS